MNGKPVPTVAVATPSRGLVHTRTVESVLTALNVAEAQGVVKRVGAEYWSFTHDLPIPDAHERVTELALKTKPDLLLFVEDDNVVPPDGIVRAVQRMQETKAGIVAIPYAVGAVGGTRWNSVYREHGKIRFTGLGLTLIDHRVFDKLPKPWFTLKRRHGTVPDGKGGLKVGLVDKPMPEGSGGVDVVFCLRVEEAGFKLAAVEDLVGGHLRVKKLGSYSGSGVNNSPHAIEEWDSIERDQHIIRGEDGTRFRPPPNELSRQFRRLGPWISGFEVDGRRYGGTYKPMEDPRLDLYQARFPDMGKVLELGALEGGHTAALARRSKHVTGVEGRSANITRGRFILSLFGVTNARLVRGNLETLSLTTLGTFDLVFCVGLLYHLPDPISLLDQMAKAAPRLFLWTHHGGEAEKDYQEFGLKDPLSGLSATSKWLSRGALLKALAKGYGTVDVLLEEPNHHGAGPAILIAAER